MKLTTLALWTAPLAALLAFLALNKGAEIESIFLQTMDGLYLTAAETPVVNDIVANVKATSILEGQKCLVTGGNRGLGKGVSKLLHEFGCMTTVATRSLDAPVPLSSAANASLLQLDLSNFQSVCEAAENAKGPFDVVILNAGVAPYKNVPTKEGFEQALGTNCVGNLLFTAALFERNLLARNAKIVVVVSETHRAVPQLDMAHLLDHVDYGLSESLSFYARSKLCLVTVSQALVARLAGHGITIHTICPGPVATDIARDAPAFVRPFIEFLMATSFQTADQAARPVALIAALPAFGGPSGSHHHMYKAKPPRHDTLNATKQEALWDLLVGAIDAHKPTCGSSFLHT